MNRKLLLITGILFICSLIMFVTACEKKVEFNSLNKNSETTGFAVRHRYQL